MIGLLKIIFGTAAGIELAAYDMAEGAVRTLAQNRQRLASRLDEISPDSREANDIRYHLSRIDDELSRFAYYGVVAPEPAKWRQSHREPSDIDLLEQHQRRVFRDRERRIDQLIAAERLKRRRG